MDTYEQSIYLYIIPSIAGQLIRKRLLLDLNLNVKEWHVALGNMENQCQTVLYIKSFSLLKSKGLY